MMTPMKGVLHRRDFSRAILKQYHTWDTRIRWAYFLPSGCYLGESPVLKEHQSCLACEIRLATGITLYYGGFDKDDVFHPYCREYVSGRGTCLYCNPNVECKDCQPNKYSCSYSCPNKAEKEYMSRDVLSDIDWYAIRK